MGGYLSLCCIYRTCYSFEAGVLSVPLWCLGFQTLCVCPSWEVVYLSLWGVSVTFRVLCIYL